VTLLGGCFLERPTKHIEKANELEKVPGSKQTVGSPQKRKYQEKDPNNMRCFLEKGAPARCSNRNPVHHKPYNQQQRRFQTQRKGNRRPSN